jgi:hypothetical protein
MNLKTLLDQTPRLRAWAAIGPVQRAELEQFAQAVLDQRATGVTADGYFVEPGNKVWILDGVGTPKPTTVCKTVALTNYYLFGQIPVSHSFLELKALQNHIKHNLGNPVAARTVSAHPPSANTLDFTTPDTNPLNFPKHNL